LHELAAKYNVSAERIRQIESKALQKMKTLLPAP
ncbi:MAG: RNA polymerase sigma factor RpoH, partial [Neisseriaceae bacterium]|nr:RNA polymerase sigma factor RpoH [Neisseriaceae bacterium]